MKKKLLLLQFLFTVFCISQNNYNHTKYDNITIEKDKIAFEYLSDKNGHLLVYDESFPKKVIKTIEINEINQKIIINQLNPSSKYFLKFINNNNVFDSIIIFTKSNSSGVINIYFNKSVDTLVAKYEKAKGNIDFSQKLINRIDSAKYSIDLCLYSFSGTVGDNIATALINAKNRGVKIRFIIEEDNKDRAPVRKLINAGIPVLTDYCGTNDGTGLVHNKFFIFDNRDNSSENDDWVISGSWNPTDPGTNDDIQNIVEIQDKSLASAYTLEFEEMWGSSNDYYDVSKAKFGKNKTNNTPHIFNISDTYTELYFSPTDNTLLRLIEVINSARNSINFSIMTFTNEDAANAIKKAYTDYRVTIRGIMNKNDAETASGTKYPFFISEPKWCTVIKSNYTTGIYHHKYMIIDGEIINSDNAWLITGSYNITNSAEYYNNENLLFFKSNRIADIYLQEFVQRFKECGGSYTSISNVLQLPDKIILEQNYPNPFNPNTKIKYSISSENNVNLKIYNILGNEVDLLVNENQKPGTYEISWSPKNISSGVYYYTLKCGNQYETKKMIYIK